MQKSMFGARNATIERSNNPHREGDPIGARELLLYAQNDPSLDPMRQEIIKNLSRKLNSNTYDSEKAVKAWRHWIDKAAKQYTIEFGSGHGFGFDVATRNTAARNMEVHEIHDMLIEKRDLNPYSSKRDNLTFQAKEGYDGMENHYLSSSPSWFAYKIGAYLARTIREVPKNVYMGRGYQIHANGKLYAFVGPKQDEVMLISHEKNPSRNSIHTPKWDRCVKNVKAKGGADSPYAVCTAMLGERGSIKAGHRRKNPTGKYVVRGILRNGTSVFYTGKTKSEWVSSNLHEALKYSSWKLTVHKATIFNRLTGITGIKFEAQVLPISERDRNPDNYRITKPTRNEFIVGAHAGRTRLWLTASGRLSGLQNTAARYRSVELAKVRAQAHLKAFPDSRRYQFDVYPLG